jgi:hypothetical protein
MAGVVHHVGAFVLAGVKPLGLCQPGVGCPCPRYLADDLDRAALDAALTPFAERGYHGTAVSQIAAGLHIRTLR